jgi:hypothetical protein
MATSPTSTTARRPTVDEWGVYDPKQAGLAALHTRLADEPESRPTDASSNATDVTRARVLREDPPDARSKP